jgi:DNA polymerase I-like protein with 3'-5' exonuclease and polymerase domains
VNTGAEITGAVHDESILEAPDGLAGEVAVILQETMIESGEAYLRKVSVEVEVMIGKTLAEK